LHHPTLLKQVAVFQELDERIGAIAKIVLSKDGTVHRLAGVQSMPVTSQPSCFL